MAVRILPLKVTVETTEEIYTIGKLPNFIHLQCYELLTCTHTFVGIGHTN